MSPCKYVFSANENLAFTPPYKSKSKSPYASGASLTREEPMEGLLGFSRARLGDSIDCSPPGLPGRPRSRSVWFSENCLKSLQMGRGHFYYPKKYMDRPQDTEMVTFYNAVVC